RICQEPDQWSYLRGRAYRRRPFGQRKWALQRSLQQSPRGVHLLRRLPQRRRSGRWWILQCRFRWLEPRRLAMDRPIGFWNWARVIATNEPHMKKIVPNKTFLAVFAFGVASSLTRVSHADVDYFGAYGDPHKQSSPQTMAIEL